MKLDSITSEYWNFIIDHAEKQSQGIHLFYKNLKYPRRLYYNKLDDPNRLLRTLNALGIVKKTLYVIANLRKVVIPYKFNYKSYELFLKIFYNSLSWIVDEWMIKDEEFSVPVWEMGKFAKHFFLNIGFDAELALNYSRIVMLILEFDNAYRYRAQDIFSLIVLENSFKNLRAELKRLFNIYLTRELQYQDIAEWGARGKVTTAFNLISYAIYIPKVKNAFLNALKEIDVEKIKFDDNDRCHISFWNGYNFEGKTKEERFEPYAELFKDVPYVKRQNSETITDFLTGK